MTTVARKVTTPAEARAVLEGIRYVLFDCDGVLWSGSHVFDGVSDALRYLRDTRGLNLRYITNNGTVSRKHMIATKFDSLNCGVQPAEVLSSAYAAQMALRSLGGRPDGLYDHGNVLVLGNEGLHEELRPAMAPGRHLYGLELREDHGEDVISIGAGRPYDMKLVARAWDDAVLPAPHGSGSDKPVTLEALNFSAVVVGFDFFFCPTLLALATMVLTRHNTVEGTSKATYVATNADPQIGVGERHWKLPGTGTMQAAVQLATGRQPDLVCGKPETRLLELLIESESRAEGRPVDPSECLMVGDRLSTDIAFGNGGGARTMLVLTGCESEADIPSSDAAAADPRGAGLRVPNFVGDGLVAFVDLLKAAGDDTNGKNGKGSG